MTALFAVRHKRLHVSTNGAAFFKWSLELTTNPTHAETYASRLISVLQATVDNDVQYIGVITVWICAFRDNQN